MHHINHLALSYASSLGIFSNDKEFLAEIGKKS